MTYWETQITQGIYFWKGLFKLPAGSRIMDWKKFSLNGKVFSDTFSMYHLLANIKTISQTTYLWITQSCWGLQFHFSNDLLLVFKSKMSLIRCCAQTCEWGPQPLGPSAATRRTCWAYFPHLVQRVFVWTGLQGNRRHIRCNGLKKTPNISWKSAWF